MKRISVYVILLSMLPLLILLESSCESTTTIDKPHPARFELAVDKPEGTVPDTVAFTGRLYGDIDTLRMCCPDDYGFCAGDIPKGCIYINLPCDSTQGAKRVYTETYIYQVPGTYRAIMLLHCQNGSFIDSVAVRVQ